jgi:hypothetical protein
VTKDVDLKNMTAKEREEIKAQALALVDHINAGLCKDEMQCPSCNLMLPVVRRTEGERWLWSVDCRCGWSACGQGPPSRLQ